MKVLFFTLILLISFACDISDSSNPPIDGLKVRFIDGVAYSDLMPVVEPDPIYIRIELEIHNSNTLESFNDVKIPKASVFLDSSNEYLGNIDLSTEWDGNLEPSEIDTITFIKNTSSDPAPFEPPCEKMIYLELDIKSDNNSKQLMIDSLWYGCAFWKVDISF